MDVGKSVVDRRAVFMQNLVSEVLEVIQIQISSRRKAIAIKTTYTEAALGMELYVDAIKFKSVIFNLLDNALKYTPEKGSIIVSGAIKRSNSDVSCMMYLLSITDTGVGMTQEQIDSLFNKSATITADGAKINVPSKGLGLILAKQIIQAHGGRIFATSEGAGKGTTFVVEIKI
jgi:signal transduction histidine kinase